MKIDPNPLGEMSETMDWPWPSFANYRRTIFDWGDDPDCSFLDPDDPQHPDRTEAPDGNLATA